MSKSVDQITAAQRVAIACVIKDTEVSNLKKTLPRGQTIDVDVTARIKGVVQIGMDTPGSAGKKPQTVNLRNADIISEVLRRLKVTPADLRKQLRAIVRSGHDKPYHQNEPNAELLSVFDNVEQDTSSKLPLVPYTTSGRAASVSVTANVQIIDPPPTGSASKRAA